MKVLIWWTWFADAKWLEVDWPTYRDALLPLGEALRELVANDPPS